MIAARKLPLWDCNDVIWQIIIFTQQQLETMADSDTTSSLPTKQQTMGSDLEEDDRSCVLVVLQHLRLLLVYISAQVAMALETFYT